MSSGPRLRDVCITGACLISCVCDGADQHWQALQQPITPPVMELGRTRYLVHPAPYIAFSAQIRNPLELKRMSRTHALGAYAAGRALDSAVLKQEREMLSRAIVIISGGCGERDVGLDEAILADPGRFSDPALLNKELSLRTRPSLFLAQLPNLLAGNISILSASRVVPAPPWARNLQAAMHSSWAAISWRRGATTSLSSGARSTQNVGISCCFTGLANFFGRTSTSQSPSDANAGADAFSEAWQLSWSWKLASMHLRARQPFGVA